MKNGKKIAFNTHLIFCGIVFLVFIGLAILCLTEKDIGWTIFFFVLSLLPIFVSVLSAFLFIFDEESLTIVYVLGIKEKILWNEIRSVVVRGSWIVKGGGLPRYEISYPMVKKYPFFVNSRMAKNHKTKKLMKKYYRKDIVWM